MINIILCGGNGTRLWPISRKLMPKQFIRLFDNKSLFQLTVNRNATVCKSQFVVSNNEQFFLASDQLEELNIEDANYLVEPVGRNTAPAIALSCFKLEYDDIVLVTPSDHIIKNQDEYEKCIQKAKEFAQNDNLVTFGIKPNYAETGYGYIQAKDFDVISFKEKPNKKTAQKYVDDGNYYWNSGIFCFKAGVFLDELKQHSPEIYETSLTAFKNSYKDSDQICISNENMLAIPEDSIDYAVMEKSSKVKVIPSDIDWNDLGSFESLDAEFEKDENNNTITKNTNFVDSHNNFLLTNENRKVVTIDVDDLVIIDTADALLISKKGSSQKVKEVVSTLKTEGGDLHNIHLTAHRPWGTYTVLEDTPGYKIKKIVVKPGKRLSLQKHFHRSEHWIVVSGTAIVTVEDKITTVRPNESTYINMGEAHRLENPGKIDLVIIEAQVGQYTGEDDIVRIKDDFKRN